MKILLFFSILFFQSLHAAIDWPHVIAEFHKQPNTYKPRCIEGGASNVNYHVALDGGEYCIRVAPKTTQAIYSDLEIEYQVLQLLSQLNVSAHPVHFDRERRTVVTHFIPHIAIPVNLRDPTTRRGILGMLHQIEDAQLTISRQFKPYHDTIALVDKSRSFGASVLSKEFYEILLPSLQQIERVLSKNPRRSLCHLDLHSKNIVQDQKRLWIIDWEYAAMSHPYLVLASMASIERWDDAEMQALLTDYEVAARQADFYTLYLYRIVADIFWTAWNHVQAHCSPIQRPYKTWEALFQKAALERVQSPQFQICLLSLDAMD